MAEGFAKEESIKRKLGYGIKSAGTNAFDGALASVNSVTAMKKFGIDISEHRSSALTPDMVENADRIYTMTAAQSGILKDYFPENTEKISTLSEKSITDPFGGDEETYSECAKEIKIAVEKLFDKLENDSQNGG